MQNLHLRQPRRERNVIMPRMARLISESGYYHVYHRGNNKLDIFLNKSDFIYYLNLLKDNSAKNQIAVCAFCLMSNHVHLIVFDKEKHLSQMMQHINTSYARYFNLKYHRTGHFFERRFCSIPIESEKYLLTAFRYILNNPRKANICSASDYIWSSYNRYGAPNSFVDTTVFVKLIGSKAEYETYIVAKYDECPELEENRLGDAWANSVIRYALHIKDGKEIQSFDGNSRSEALKLLKQRGLTDKQIERLTGLPGITGQPRS